MKYQRSVDKQVISEKRGFMKQTKKYDNKKKGTYNIQKEKILCLQTWHQEKL